MPANKEKGGATTTKQGVRDLNYYGPRRPKDVEAGRPDEPPKPTPPEGNGDRSAAK